MSSTEKHPYASLVKPDTNNATWFNPKEKCLDVYWKEDESWKEASSFRHQNKRDWFTYLEELNQGTRNGKHTYDDYWTYRDNIDLIGNVSDQIGTSTTQAQRAKRVYFHLHDDYISGIRKDITAVAVVAYVIEHSDEDVRRFEPQTKRENGQTVAESLADQFGLRQRQIIKTYGKVKYHLRLTELRSNIPDFDAREMDRRGLYEGPDEDDNVMYQSRQ
jgi:hypothetical protein